MMVYRGPSEHSSNLALRIRSIGKAAGLRIGPRGFRKEKGPADNRAYSLERLGGD
jgi:hypothetical protein